MATLCSGVGCSPGRPQADADRSALAALHMRAQRLDRSRGTSLYTWLADHEPERLDVTRGAPGLVASFVRDASVRAITSDLREACRTAKHDRALLLAFVAEKSPERALVMDCGFALQRDHRAVVVAPR